MHIGRGDWMAAEQLAEKHDPEALTRILVIFILLSFLKYFKNDVFL